MPIEGEYRKSGQPRTAPMMYVPDGDRLLVIASNIGAPKHPAWYHNLVADPDIVLQDGTEVVEMRARELAADERAEWWARATEVWPAYDDYQKRTDRQIPVLVLEPRQG